MHHIRLNIPYHNPTEPPDTETFSSQSSTHHNNTYKTPSPPPTLLRSPPPLSPFKGTPISVTQRTSHSQTILNTPCENVIEDDFLEIKPSPYNVPPTTETRQGTSYQDIKRTTLQRAGLRSQQKLHQLTVNYTSNVNDGQLPTSNVTPSPSLIPFFSAINTSTSKKRKANFLEREGPKVKKARLNIVKPPKCLYITWANYEDIHDENSLKNFFLLHLPSLLHFLFSIRNINLENIEDVKKKLASHNATLPCRQHLNLNSLEHQSLPEIPATAVATIATSDGNQGEITRAQFTFVPVDVKMRGKTHYLNIQKNLNTMYISSLSPNTTGEKVLRLFTLLDIDDYLEFFHIINAQKEELRLFTYKILGHEIALNALASKIMKIILEVSKGTLSTYSSALNKLLENLIVLHNHMTLATSRDQSSLWEKTIFTKKLVLQLIEKQQITHHHVYNIITLLITQRTPHSSIRAFFYGLSFWWYRITGKPLSYYFTLRDFRGLCKYFDLYVPVKGACYIDPSIRMEIVDFCQRVPHYQHLYAPICIACLCGPRTNEVVKAKRKDFTEYPDCYMWNIRKLKNSLTDQTKVIIKNPALHITISQALEACADNATQNPDGFITIKRSGEPATIQSFQTDHREMGKAFKLDYKQRYGDDLSHLANFSFYSYRISVICDMALMGLSDKEIKCVTGHSYNSNVLNQYYLRRLDSILQGGVSMIFYQKDKSEYINEMFTKIQQLNDLKLKHILKEKIVSDCKITFQHNPDVLQQVEEQHIASLPTPSPLPPKMTILSPTLLEGKQPEPPTDDEFSEYEDEEENDDFSPPPLPPPHTREVSSLDLDALNQLPRVAFDPAKVYNDQNFIKTYRVPIERILEEQKRQFQELIISDTYLEASPKNQYAALHMQATLLGGNVFLKEKKQLDKLAKNYGI